MSIRIAVYTHCQMNENPCSNQEIYMLFEHGSELENTQNEPYIMGAQWLSGRVLDSRPKGRGFRASPASLCCVLEQEH